jgi:hypothetical protein
MLSFTHDESLTYIYHVRHGILGAFDFSVSNNQFLNSLLMWVSSLLFGTGEFALRLPNLAAHVAFLVGSFVALRRFSGPVLSLCGFVILNTNMLVLDYFSLARGYGLGLAFMVWSVCFYLKAIRAETDVVKPDVARAVWFAWLAVLSNLVFLNYYAALVLAHLLLDGSGRLRNSASISMAIRQVPRELWTRNRFLVGHVALLVISAAPMVWEMQQGHELYFGGANGFWMDTVPSLIAASRYGSFFCMDVSVYVHVLIAATIALALVVAMPCLRHPDKAKVPAIFLLMVVFAAAVSTVVQHRLFGAMFLMERTAIFFIPLYVLLLVALADILAGLRPVLLRYVVVAVLCVSALGAFAHMISLRDLKTCYTWSYDANAKDMIRDLVKEHAERSEMDPSHVRLGVNWVFEPSANYYRLTWHLDWLEPVTRRGLNGAYDYYFFAPEDRKAMASRSLRILREHSPTHNILALSTDCNKAPECPFDAGKAAQLYISAGNIREIESRQADGEKAPLLKRQAVVSYLRGLSLVVQALKVDSREQLITRVGNPGVDMMEVSTNNPYYDALEKHHQSQFATYKFALEQMSLLQLRDACVQRIQAHYPNDKQNTEEFRALMHESISSLEIERKVAETLRGSVEVSRHSTSQTSKKIEKAEQDKGQ